MRNKSGRVEKKFESFALKLEASEMRKCPRVIFVRSSFL